MARGRPRKNSDTPSSEDQSAPESQTTLERDLFMAADKLRKNLEPSDYRKPWDQVASSLIPKVPLRIG
jgi:type I restriction enzyme M protein